MYPVIQNFILRFHTRRKRILSQVIGLTAVLLIGTLGLFIERLHVRRQQAMQTECMALFLGKGRTLVEIGIVEESVALELCFYSR